MARVTTLSSSPSTTSRTEGVLSVVSDRVRSHGHSTTAVVLRDLPARPLLLGDTTDPDVASAVDDVLAADAVVVTTPVYKASFGGLLKTFLDLLPQFALQGKTVLPVATGGTPAHVLVVDYALRPVLSSLGAAHITPGWFVLSSHIELSPGGDVRLDPAAATPLHEVTDTFAAAVTRLAPADGHAAVA